MYQKWTRSEPEMNQNLLITQLKDKNLPNKHQKVLPVPSAEIFYLTDLSGQTTWRLERVKNIIPPHDSKWEVDRKLTGS